VVTVDVMNEDPLEPSAGSPPRQVYPWTQVPGHDTVHPDRRPSFCSCGARQAADDGLTGREWRAAHLQEAWPFLVPRLNGERYEDWMSRISTEHVAASLLEQQIGDELGLGKPIPEGGRFPVMTDEYMRAGDRVEVLQHQLDEVRAKVLQRLGFDDAEVVHHDIRVRPDGPVDAGSPDVSQCPNV
jgi:hypothetical protein